MGRWSATLIGLFAAPAATAYTVEPLLGRDGFAGEPTCRECHMHDPAKAAYGQIVIDGLPDRFVPGQIYALTVRLNYVGVKRSGFQASFRFKDGAPAGTVTSDDDRAAVLADPDSQVPYAFHTEAGLKPTAVNSAAWRVRWTAPLDQRVVIASAAGNASNADDSALGDVIVLARREIKPAP